MTTATADKILKWFGVLFSIGVCGFLWARLYFGVDLTDEAFYNALPLSFARGRHPYIDELIVVQSAGILLTPLVQLYLYFMKSEEGLVLFFRQGFFFLSLFTAYVGYRFLRQAKLPLIPSLFFSLLILTFWPFSIPSLSYNTLGMLFFVSGSLMVLQTPGGGCRGWLLPMAVLLLLLAIFSYPTLLAPCFFLLVWGLKNFRKLSLPKSVLLVLFFEVLTAGAAAAYLIFFYAGLERLKTIYGFIRAYGVHGTIQAKLALISEQFLANRQWIALALALLLIPPLTFRKSKWFSVVMAGGLGVALFRFPNSNLTLPSFHLLILVVALSAFVFSLVRKEWRVLALVAVLGGGISAWTSSNGLTNFPIGGLIGIIAYGLLFEGFISFHQGFWSKTLTVFFVGTLVTYQCRALTRSVYGDDSDLKHLTEVIPSGAYRGLKTTSEKKIFLEQLESDLQGVSAGQKTIAFFDFFAAGPLVSNLTLSMPIIWSNSLSQFPQDRQLLAAFYEENPERLPDVLLWFQSIPVANYFKYDLRHQKQDALKDSLMTHYEAVSIRDDYTVYRRLK
jgi:hypothetical protein